MILLMKKNVLVTLALFCAVSFVFAQDQQTGSDSKQTIRRYWPIEAFFYLKSAAPLHFANIKINSYFSTAYSNKFINKFSTNNRSVSL